MNSSTGGFDFEAGSGRSECEEVQRIWFLENMDLYEDFCPPYWDRISCWPATERGRKAVIPCMDQLNGILYDTTYNASLDCMEDGMWANKSDYSNCRQLQVEDPLISSNVITIIYFCGHSLSLLALLIAFSICIYFKEMRCLRNKIHANLFLTYILANSCWILTVVMQDAHFTNSNVEFSWCVSLVLLRYFHLATFFWMFVEGLYLFVQVIATFSVESSKMKLRHYVLIGWGIPLFVVILWATLTYQSSNMVRVYRNTSQSSEFSMSGCPFIEKSSTEWVYIVPVLLLLATNTFFLLSIFYVVVTKLRSTGRGEANHQNWKAAKALLVIIPLLGITYLITILGPTDVLSVSYVIFEHVRAVLLSTQGFTVTLPYCFLNTEVKGILTHHWRRWRITRNIRTNYTRGQSSRNSISMAGYYACESHVTNISHSRRNSFPRFHPQYVSGSGPGQTCESQLTSSVVLERGGFNSNRVIPVIQEESFTEGQAATLISITPATPLATSPAGESADQEFPVSSTVVVEPELQQGNSTEFSRSSTVCTEVEIPGNNNSDLAETEFSGSSIIRSQTDSPKDTGVPANNNVFEGLEFTGSKNVSEDGELPGGKDVRKATQFSGSKDVHVKPEFPGGNVTTEREFTTCSSIHLTRGLVDDAQEADAVVDVCTPGKVNSERKLLNGSWMEDDVQAGNKVVGINWDGELTSIRWKECRDPEEYDQ